MTSKPMELTVGEAAALAARIAAKRLDVIDGWLEWGDYPELSEAAFQLLETWVGITVKLTKAKVDEIDIEVGIDSQALWERAQ